MTLRNAKIAGGLLFLAAGFVILGSPPPVDVTGVPAHAAADSQPSPRMAPPPIAPSPDAAATAAPSLPDATEILTRAEQVLRQALTTHGDPEVQRSAALALSRTGDGAAIAFLEAQLGTETLDLRKIPLAYALARSGHDEGVDILRELLHHKKRDVRLSAARHLTFLGRDDGKSILQYMLGLKMYRIGAAALLARLGDERGFRSLREDRNARVVLPETAIRINAALGRAGDSSALEPLRAIVARYPHHLGAAAALAALGDRSAAPTLHKQLAVTSLRVRAAQALRQLDSPPEIQRALAFLLPELDRDDTHTRLASAEALLILCAAAELARLP